MAYHSYQTNAFVIASEPYGEHSERLLFLTRELGMVSALAQGVRKERSKLRFSLQPLALVSIVLVRGRETWRVVGAANPEHLWLTFRDKPALRALVTRLFALCRRLLHGEEKNEFLFAVLERCVQFLSEQKAPLSSSQLLTVEAIAVARILRSLGYLGEYPTFREFLKTQSFDFQMLETISSERPRLLSVINASLKATNL